jgi:tetratricopeptide (TPR) repeat protein
MLAIAQLFNKSWWGLLALKEQQSIESRFTVMRKIAIWVMVLLILSSFVSAELAAINANSNSSGGDQGPTLLLGLKIREGVALTDGNRHPLYPALISLFATRDLGYFTKAKFVSLAIGLTVLLTVYLLGRRLYSSGVGLIATFLLSINNQFRWASCNALAEALLILLFLIAWYWAIKGFAESQHRYLAWAGFCAGLAYLTKGTGLLLLFAFLASIIIMAIVFKRIPARRGTLYFLLTFVVVASILWVYNFSVYRNPFYNYNTTHAMWLEEWEESYALQSPPTAFTYLKTHTFQEIIARQWAGMGKMVHIFTDVLLRLKSPSIQSWLKSPFVSVPAIAIVGGLALYSREKAISYWQSRKEEVIFTAVLVILFYLAFAWYAQVLADLRFPFPLVPIIYLIVTGFLWELGNGLLAKFDLVGDARLKLLGYVAFCALSLPLLGSDLVAFKFEDPFRSDRLNNLDRMEVMSWLEREVEAGTVIAYEPGHTLPTWMYADRYDFISVPYKAPWQTVESYLEERGARYIIFNRELLARRKSLYGHLLYRKGSMRIDVLALPSNWDLALAYGGLPCQYCIFRLNWPEPGEADACPEPSRREVRQHARLGDAYRSQGEVIQAITEYEEALELDDEGWPGLHVALGRSYQAVELLDGAVEEYERAIELRPEEAWYHTLLGEAYLEQGRAEEALAAYMKALALGAEGWPSIHQSLGQVYKALGRPEEAVAEYKEAIQLEPDDAGHHKLLGDLYRFQGEMGKAAIEYEKVIELNGHHWPDLHVALGRVYEALGRLDEAQAEYGKAGLDHIEPTQFGDSILLLGYGIEDSQVVSKGKFEVNLYWQCLQTIGEKYIVYLKLVNPVYHIWGQEDSSPTPPTNLWQRGTIVKDPHPLAVLPATPPGTYNIEVILWDTDRQQNLETVGGEPLLLGPLEISPPEALTAEALDIEHPTRVNLGDKISLLGYNLESGFRPGDGIHLTLFWQALAGMDEDYTVFTHLIDEQGALWGQKDNQPVDGFYPTTRWRTGEIVRDQYDLTISPETLPGRYWLEVGMYLAETGERLMISDNGSSPSDTRILLQEIRVEG